MGAIGEGIAIAAIGRVGDVGGAGVADLASGETCVWTRPCAAVGDTEIPREAPA